MPYTIYADIESLIKKVDNCEKNLEHSSTTRIGKHIPCAHSESTILAFNHIEDKHTLYRREDCMKRFCKSLTEHAKNIIDSEQKKNVTVNKKELKSSQDGIKYPICRKKINKSLQKIKNTKMLEANVILQVNTETWHIAFVI